MTVETADIDGLPILRSGPYLGNGLTASFDYGFSIRSQTFLRVVRQNADLTETTLTLTTDYTVSGVDVDSGGSITLVDPATALPTGTKLLILYNGDFNQSVDYSSQNGVNLSQLEVALDKIVMHLRQLKELADRAATVDVFNEVSVAGLVANLNALILIEADITIAADNIASIVAAPGAASAASTSASEAAASAVAAAASAVTAAADAVTAASAAGAASGSASAASGSASAASASASAASDSADDAAASAAAAAGVGEIFNWPLGTAPSYAKVCNGTAISRTTFSALFSVIGTTFGVGDGSTTFNLPDYRGAFLRSLDDGKGYDTGRAIGTYQADQNLGHTHTVTGTTGASGTHTHDVKYQNRTGGGSTNDRSDLSGGNTVKVSEPGGDHTHTVSGTAASNGGTEARPKNVSVLVCIRT